MQKPRFRRRNLSASHLMYGINKSCKIFTQAPVIPDKIVNFNKQIHNELIERLHSRIFSIHLKDKTGKDASPANTNRPWGEGDTPIAGMLKLIQKNKWPIYCDIELEYPVPADSDARQEVKKCVDYCRDILV